MIESERKEIDEKLKLIDNSLKQCTNIYRVCFNIDSLTFNLDKKIKEFREKIVSIANSFDGLNSLTTSIDGQISVLEAQISILEKEKDKIIRRARSMRGLVSPQLDSLSVHKKECMDTVSNPTLTELSEKESFSHMLNVLASISSTFKSGLDTYLEFLEKAYPDIFKYIKLR